MRLAEWHKKQQLTVAEAAALMRCHRVTYHKYLAGRAMPRPATAARILALTDGQVTAGDLQNAYAERSRRR